jgi:hypothetical protein
LGNGPGLPDWANFCLLGERFLLPGTDVMILKIFSPKNLAKKMAFLTQNKAKF